MTHQQLVRKTLKSGHDIWLELTPSAANLLHLALGVAGESGEIVDTCKKRAIYGQPLDKDNLIEEIGDTFYYLEGLCQAIGVTRAQVIAANIKKLQKRYAGGYSDRAAFLRADKLKK